MDLRLQARSKLYTIGVAVAVLLGLVARFLFDRDDAGNVLAVFYLLGLGGTTYIFGASLVLLEKSQGTLRALRTTPLTSAVYIMSKVITLTSFTVIEGAIIYAVGFFGVPLNPLPLVLGVVCLGVFYTFLGMGQVASHDSVFSFLIPGALLIGSVTQWPFLYVLEIGPPLLWHFIPTQGPLLLMLAASEPLALWQWVYGIGVSLASICLAGWWAKRRFASFISLQEG